MRCNGSNWAVYSPGSWDGFRNDVWALWAGVIMRLEHHLVGGYVRYISPHIIIIICNCLQCLILVILLYFEIKVNAKLHIYKCQHHYTLLPAMFVYDVCSYILYMYVVFLFVFLCFIARMQFGNKLFRQSCRSVFCAIFILSISIILSMCNSLLFCHLMYYKQFF